MLEKILEKARKMGWVVSTFQHGEQGLKRNALFDITFSKYSPAGQDFSFSIEFEKDEDKEDADLLLHKIYEFTKDFDVSSETFIWLDSDGHGTNGAPYDMKDVYEDFEWCLDEVEKLYDEISDDCLKGEE